MLFGFYILQESCIFSICWKKIRYIYVFLSLCLNFACSETALASVLLLWSWYLCYLFLKRRGRAVWRIKTSLQKLHLNLNTAFLTSQLYLSSVLSQKFLCLVNPSIVARMFLAGVGFVTSWTSKLCFLMISLIAHVVGPTINFIQFKVSIVAFFLFSPLQSSF